MAYKPLPRIKPKKRSKLQKNIDRRSKKYSSGQIYGPNKNAIGNRGIQRA